jgi:hypothetical protein
MHPADGALFRPGPAADMAHEIEEAVHRPVASFRISLIDEETSSSVLAVFATRTSRAVFIRELARPGSDVGA